MSKLSKNILYNIIGQGLLIVLGFISVKCIFKQLGEDALGIIYFSAMINSLFSMILSMGISSTTVREVSAHFESEPHYTKNLIRTFSLFYWGAFTVLGLVIFFLAPTFIDKWINLKTMDSNTAIVVIRILGITSSLGLIESLYASLFQGLQRMEFNNLISVIATGLQQFGTILILAFWGSFFFVVYWFATCYGLRVLTYLILSAKFFSLSAIIPGYSSGVIKKNFGFASRMMFISITSAIHLNADKVIVSKLLPIGTFGYYALAYGNVSKGTLLTGAISQAAFPSFSALFTAGNRTGLMSQYRKLHDLLCFGIVPIFAAVPFALLPLFSYILNEEVARLLLLPTTLLCIGFYMNGTLTIPYIFSLAVGKPGISARQHFYDLFVTLPVAVLFVYYLDIIGASISVVFLYVFHYIYALPRICAECLGIPTWKWFLHVFKVLVLVGLTYGVAWTIVKLTNSVSLGYLVLAYLLASFVFLTSAYFMITEELRESLLQHFQLLRRLLNGF